MKSIELYEQSIDFLKEKLGDFKPEILMILGSGIGFLADMCENAVSISYSEIPNFKHSTVTGHNGRFVFGKLADKNVAIMDGRLHVYEGYTPEEAAFPVYVMRGLGTTKMIVTNAAGAINLDYKVGDLMLITDHIKLAALTPLLGANIDEFGPRFVDMTNAYTPSNRYIAKNAAEEIGLNLHEGVYYYAQGPHFETPAEIRAMRILGADAVGMSTVFEVTAAAHCSMEVLGISLMTNMAAGVTNNPLSHVDVVDAANKAKDKFSKLILLCAQRI